MRTATEKLKEAKELMGRAKPGSAEHGAAVRWYVRAFVEAKKTGWNPGAKP